MSPAAGFVFALCIVTSGVCTWLWQRAYRRTRARVLFWSALCFLLLTANNLLVFVDVIMLPRVDLSLLRFVMSLLATGVLIYGFVWDL